MQAVEIQQRVAPEAAGHGADVSVCLEMALAVLLRLALSCGDELACRFAGAVFATWLRNGSMRFAYCALSWPCWRLATGTHRALKPDSLIQRAAVVRYSL